VTDLNQQSHEAWEANASFWDDRMADGNDFQRYLVGPATERLLKLQPGERVVECACGNGVMARRLAELGAQIVAFDFSANMIKAARARGTVGGKISYQVIDGTNEAAMVALGPNSFDAAVCNMAIMDMAEIVPMMAAMHTLLKPDGRFVFSLCHPCFNNSGCARGMDETDIGGVETRYWVKVSEYAHGRNLPGTAMRDQPSLQVYFNRTLTELFDACFQAGFVVVGLEEPVFPPPNVPSSWALEPLFEEIPPVLVARVEKRRG
jgi:SAM-dependent methyltransferase